ncbi:hypothetical protein FSS13T_26420 [Flavobacterium saliperosum S13]|uniref:Uncharacterized protein n=2 Tax=Flavobacterium saliperosum TaxID=329186 RepID=A0A1G4W4Q8_9FLAO|nr:hypothetical protein [Flavobacterium saliperosum]ESU21486.1 hypothetical protein FSS13T_26420 [Flavobacterium saliperosum S13]SCX16677.1 hypothetical protein SAMN02927925_02401 [Flavobacterium saliperosum]
MKNHYFLAALVLPVLSFAQTETTSIELDIRGRSCIGGLGICTTTSPELYKTSMKNFNVSKKSFNTMLLQIEIEKLSVEDQIMFFGKEYAKIAPNEILEFTQDEDFVFDKDTLLYLGFDTKYQVLKKGNYPIEVTKDKVAVTLTLSEG